MHISQFKLLVGGMLVEAAPSTCTPEYTLFPLKQLPSACSNKPVKPPNFDSRCHFSFQSLGRNVCTGLKRLLSEWKQSELLFGFFVVSRRRLLHHRAGDLHGEGMQASQHRGLLWELPEVRRSAGYCELRCLPSQFKHVTRCCLKLSAWIELPSRRR